MTYYLDQIQGCYDDMLAKRKKVVEGKLAALLNGVPPALGQAPTSGPRRPFY